jgi:hypothetical protein
MQVTSQFDALFQKTCGQVQQLLTYADVC